MKLSHGRHLAYCTNVHRGSDWTETFSSLEQQVMQVRKIVCPSDSFAIGLRLSAAAACELSQPEELSKFRNWLGENDAYVFTINGFPYGNFHGQPVKEEVYRPDWTDPRRLEYTVALFEILASLLPEGEEGSVSTLPASFKEFHPSGRLPEQAYQHLLDCAQRMQRLSDEKGLDLHLGLEPEPLGWFETTPETIRFFDQLLDRAGDPDLVRKRIGVNYDCCHLAIEGENAREGLDALQDKGLRLSKLHLSSALRARPEPEILDLLESYVEEVYLHQVVTIGKGEVIERIKDLDLALRRAKEGTLSGDPDEWRIHFHVPLHAPPGNRLGDTRRHVAEALDWLSPRPDGCNHLEMETYTWEVLPDESRSRDVVQQVAEEYHWTLGELKKRGMR